MKLAPILLFVYNRLQHTIQTIQSLQENTLSSESTLFIYSDGPKSEKDVEAVNQIREYIRPLHGFAEVVIIEREKNWGLAANVIDGVTTQVEKFGKVIVLEDDLFLSPHFLEFMNDALVVYEDETRVGHVFGCTYLDEPQLPDTYLLRFAGSWGWATWQRAWQYFNPDGKVLLDELVQKKLTREFDFNGTYHYTRMLREQIEGKNNSWAIRWSASLFLNNLLSLNTNKSLVSNTGMDGSGTHCDDTNLYRSFLYSGKVKVEKISPIEEYKPAREAYMNYYKKTNSFQAKAIRRIKKEWKNLIHRK